MRCPGLAVLFCLPLAVLPATPSRAADSLEPARHALSMGEADSSIRVLKQALESNGKDAEALNLLCRVEFQLDQIDQAVTNCEQAAKIADSNSNYHLWLGRAYGEKADHSSMMAAYSLARKVKSEFENAVRLDGGNAAAMADLGEFYVSAPSIAGGGISKAQALLPALDRSDVTRAHELRARISAAGHDDTKVEAELKAAIASSPHPASQWMSLASFYRHKERWDDMVAAVKQGFAVDKEHGFALVDGASVLTKANREPQLAEQMLRSYLGSPNKAEEAPAFQVRMQLGKLLTAKGDSQGAQREFQAALGLAHDYRPASRLATSSHH